MAAIFVPGDDPDDDVDFRRRWRLGPNDPVPVLLDSPTFDEDHARNLEMKRDNAVRQIRPAPVRTETRNISKPRNGKNDPEVIDNGGENFACVGGNVGLAAGGCYGGGEPYLYSGLAWPPGVDVTVGHAPRGAKGYLKGWSASANGLPGAGASFTNGHPSANAWTTGTPGANVSYGMSLNDIADRFRSAAADASRGIYNLIGRPYDRFDR